MTEAEQNEVKAAEAAAAAPAGEVPAGAETASDALAKAVAGGYVEPEPPSLKERVTSLIADVEHAMAHNAPMTVAMLTEMKALLLGDERVMLTGPGEDGGGIIRSFAEMAKHEKGINTAPTDLEIERAVGSYRVRVMWASTPPKSDDYKVEVRSDGGLSEAGEAVVRRDFKEWKDHPEQMAKDIADVE